MQAITIQLRNAPLNLTCVSDGTIIIEKNSPFRTYTDIGEEYYAEFDIKGFSIGSEFGKEMNSYGYGERIWYKQDMSLVKWLKSFNLEL